MLQEVKCARKRAKRTNRRYGDLVRLAAQISGRSISMVYAVLGGRAKSEPVERAIEEARRQMRRTRSKAA